MNKPLVPVVAAVITDSRKKILITQRAPHQHLAGLWEFPGGTIEVDETPEQALCREIQEELGIDIDVGKMLWRQTFEYDIKRVDIRFLQCRMHHPQQNILCREVADFKWVGTADLSNFSFPPADFTFISMLLKGTLPVNDKMIL